MDRSHSLLLLSIGVLLALSVMFVLPFLNYFLLAVLLAYLLVPVQKRVEKRLRPRYATAVVVTSAGVVVVLPLAYVVWETAAEAIALLERIREGEISLAAPEAELESLTGMEVDLTAAAQSAVANVQFDSVLGVFGTVTHHLLGIGLTLFLMYYFLKDRHKFLRWLHRTTPLPDDVQDRLFTEVGHILGAVLVGHVFVALVQGILAGLGLVATGVPNAVFWTVPMIVLSLFPIVGSFLVWGPAAIYLFVTGDTVAAVALFVWGTVVVGIADDYLRPVVVDRYAQINPSVIIIGVLGGAYVLGFMGIFFGPVVIGALRATLDVFREEVWAEPS